MKKNFLVTLALSIAIVLMATTVLSINLTFNLRLRRKAFEYFGKEEIVQVEPQIFFLGHNEKMASAHSTELLSLKNETGKNYFDLMWLRESGITYHYDATHEQLNIVGPNFLISAEKNGSTYVNDEIVESQLAFKQIDEFVYAPYEFFSDLNLLEFIGLVKWSDGTKGHVVYYNDYIAYKVLRLDQSTPVFDSVDNVDAYFEKKNQYSSFYDIKNVFSKVSILGKIKNEAVFTYLVDAYTLEVITEDGLIGYIRSWPDQIQKIETLEPSKTFSTKRFFNEPIMMYWEAVYSFNPDTSTIPVLKGVNVASPTWYELIDESGNVSSKVSQNYIDWAKERDYHIWALVSNAFNIDRTHAFLHSAPARKNFIDRMISEALTYGYEGINVDFENVYLADKDALTHFINELAFEMRKHDLIVSMDVTIMGGSDNWSKCYDHPFLGKIVDYLVIMTYDEFWASSPISGPVASYAWVYRSIEQLASVVEPDKLVLGLPFYTRVWRETPSTERINAMTTKSTAIGMEAQKNFIERNQLTPIWDENAKMYYASFIEEGALVKIWIENERTLGHKAQIVNDLGLAGVAAWTRSLGTAEIWETLFDILY